MYCSTWRQLASVCLVTVVMVTVVMVTVVMATVLGAAALALTLSACLLWGGVGCVLLSWRVW